MKIAFSFRNLESSDSMKNYATDKIARLQKYMQAPMDVVVTFSVERHLHCVDLSIHAGSESYLGREDEEDMYASIDLVVDKIKNQLRHNKDKHNHERRPSDAEVAGE